jgi:hypothetical protein
VTHQVLCTGRGHICFSQRSHQLCCAPSQALWPRSAGGFVRICKGCYTLSIQLSDFTVWRHTWRENWVNRAVLTGNNAGLRSVFSSRLSHRELRSSQRASHSCLSLPAETTMALSQGTSVSSNSFSRWASHDVFLFKYHSTFYAFFSSFRITLWPMWLANSFFLSCKAIARVKPAKTVHGPHSP